MKCFEELYKQKWFLIFNNLIFILISAVCSLFNSNVPVVTPNNMYLKKIDDDALVQQPIFFYAKK